MLVTSSPCNSVVANIVLLYRLQVVAVRFTSVVCMLHATSLPIDHLYVCVHEKRIVQQPYNQYVAVMAEAILIYAS